MIVRSDNAQIEKNIQEVRALIQGNGVFSGWSFEKKADGLAKWVNTLEDYADYIETTAEKEGSTDAEDTEWPKRIKEVISECYSAIDSFNKNPEDRTLEERIYPGMSREGLE